MVERKRTAVEPLSDQMRKRISTKDEIVEQEGNFKQIISTGSTLLDLAISGGRIRGGGLPGGIFVEVFGPSGSGKTVLLCEIAGAVQRHGGGIMFHDPEARLNTQFAKMFGLTIKEEDYHVPDTVPEVFSAVRSWEPEGKDKIHGIFADSLAALSTDMEMDNEDGDKMGGRRAKEFSEQMRRTCRELPKKNYLMVASNQIREIMDAQKYAPKYASPGGKAMEHYPSLRLRMATIKKYDVEIKVRGKDVKKIVGVRSEVFVFKSSLWKPFGTAPVTIIFDYGIDDIRENLQFVKDFSKYSVYTLNGETLDKSMTESIKIIEEDKLENQLREEVIDLWEEIEKKFESNRKPKR